MAPPRSAFGAPPQGGAASGPAKPDPRRLLDGGGAVLAGPVQTQSLVQQIASRLASDIVTGVYSPGERLKEQEIALRFGTSRAPLREAFRVLERDGLIEIFPWRGVCVVEHGDDEIRELFDIRAELLGVCVRRITEEGAAEKIAAIRAGIRALIELTEAGGDERDYKQQTASISALTASLAGNRYLDAMVTDFRQKLLWYYCFLGQSTMARRRESNRLWRRMLQAMEQGDADAAAARAREVTHAAAAFALQQREQARGGSHGDPAPAGDPGLGSRP